MVNKELQDFQLVEMGAQMDQSVPKSIDGEH